LGFSKKYDKILLKCSYEDWQFDNKKLNPSIVPISFCLSFKRITECRNEFNCSWREEIVSEIWLIENFSTLE
jgi:hypothetical protein